MTRLQRLYSVWRRENLTPMIYRYYIKKYKSYRDVIYGDGIFSEIWICCYFMLNIRRKNQKKTHTELRKIMKFYFILDVPFSEFFLASLQFVIAQLSTKKLLIDLLEWKVAPFVSTIFYNVIERLRDKNYTFSETKYSRLVCNALIWAGVLCW